MRDAEQVLFARGGLDRAAHLRGDPAALDAAARDPAARCLALWKGKALCRTGAVFRLGWLPLDHPILAEGAGEQVFLGRDGTAPRFAQDVSALPLAAEEAGGFLDPGLTGHPDLPEAWRFADLRTHMPALDAGEAGTAAAAKGLVGWHAIHRYCARCGAASAPAEAGWRRACPACGAQHFPRTDPVVIMLVTRGNSVLLGRQRGWPDAMYSLLAGFVEPGESLEAAVRRETWEEAGIAVGAVRYLASQPWPFPASLMIGCAGEALTGEIRRDDVELEAVGWYGRETVLAGLSGLDPALRPARKGAIARFLLEAWVSDGLR
ncbi:NAD(+) diphosphatase [soil metagenome]